jgi:hypothetical protein
MANVRFSLLFGALLVVVAAGNAAGMRAYPPPPLGWERDITPGFDPPIETVLVQDCYAGDEKVKARVEAWGEGACAVLMRRFTDPKWGDYRTEILKYAAHCDDPAIKKMILEDAMRLADALEDDSDSERQLMGLIGFMAASGDSELVNAALDIIKRVPEKNRVSLMRIFTARLGDLERSMAVVREVRDASSDEGARGALTQRLNELAFRARGEECMSIILEREGAEAKQKAGDAL